MSHRTLLTLADLPEGLLDRVVAALRQAEPAAVGVLVTGSYAGGRATSQSDLDVTVLTAVPALGHYRTWFEPLEAIAGDYSKAVGHLWAAYQEVGGKGNLAYATTHLRT